MVDTHPALALRAELYHALAEVLVPPMLWMTQPGMMWPLYEAARALRPFSHSARQAAETLASIGTETEQERLARYEAAFMGNGRPRLWLYESMMVNGRLLGPETQKLALLYQTAGLQMVSSELPDHASMELTFLGYVAETVSISAAWIIAGGVLLVSLLLYARIYIQKRHEQKTTILSTR